MRSWWTSLKAGITAMLLGASSWAVLSQSAQADGEPLKIAAREDRPPYVAKGATSGIEIEIISAVLEELQLQPHFLQMPRPRARHMFENKSVDMLLAQNPALPGGGCTTDWYITHKNVALTLKARSIKLAGLADLKPYAVVSFLGARDQLGPDFRDTVADAASYTETGAQFRHIELLYEGRADVVVGDLLTLNRIQTDLQKETGVFKELHVAELLPPTRYVARFHDDSFCASFNRALATVHKSGKYKNIWNKYEIQLADQ